MAGPHLLHLARRRLAWLLCIALLLPFAQVAGTTHLQSHVAEASLVGNGPSDDREHLHQRCDLCALATTAASPFLPVAAAGPQLGRDLPAPPVVLAASTTLARPLAWFRSRAPPQPSP